MKQDDTLAILFDMDGVLLDSVSHNAQAFTTVLAEYDIDFATIIDPHGQQWGGSSLTSILEAVERQTGTQINLSTFAKRVDKIQLKLMNKNGATSHPSLVTFLEELQQNQAKIGLGSASKVKRIQIILNSLGIAPFFQAIVGAEDVIAHKPDPAVYIEAANRLGVEPAQCVVIEDSLAGIEAAKRSGMKVIGFLKFQPQKQSLHQADLLVHDYHEFSYEKISQLIKS